MVKNLQQTPLSKNWLGPYTITNINTDTHTIIYKVRNKNHRKHINDTKSFNN